MNLDLLQKSLGVVSGIVALITGLGAVLWAYAKYVLERGSLPPAQFDIGCTPVGSQGGKKLVEILVHLKNLGTATLVASDVRVDVLYLDGTDKIELFQDPTKSTFGRLNFSRSPNKELFRHEGPEDVRGIRIVPHHTFVQPGVDQMYTLVTAVPESASYMLVWSSFEYVWHPKPISRIALFISRQIGLVPYSLSHVSKPHTIERVFRVSGE